MMSAGLKLRYGISKVVGITLLLLISVAIGVALYAYVENRAASVNNYQVSAKPVKVEAVRLYSFKDFIKFFLYVSVDPPKFDYVYVKDPSTKVVYKAKPESVQKLGRDLYLLVVTVPKSIIKSKVVQVTISVGGNQASAVYPFSVDLRQVPVSSLPIVYLLAVEGYPSSWVRASTLLNLLQPLVGKLISKVVVVNTSTAWEELLSKGPASAIVINCHGEAVPVTASIERDAANPSKWVQMFRRIGERVRNGWIWVSVIGYPFYYVANSTGLYSWSPNSGFYGPGDSGAKIVLGEATGGYGLFWGNSGADLLAKITNAGLIAANLTGIGLPKTVYASRSMNVGAFLKATVEPFYVNKTGGMTYYSAEAIYTGRGAFVLIGFSAFEDNASANASVALSIYAYIFKRSPSQVNRLTGSAYVLDCLDSRASWSDTRVANGVAVNVEGIASEAALKIMGFKVKHILSADDVWGVLGAPESKAAVINTLEEALPMPSELIQTPATTTYWHALANEGIVVSLYAYGAPQSTGLVSYESKFTLEDGEVTLYVVPLTLASTSEGNVALQINYSVNAVRFTDTGIVAYVNSGGTTTQHTLMGFQLLHTYTVTFKFDKTLGTLTIQVKDLDTGETSSTTGDGAPSQVTLWLGTAPASSETEASALIKELVISGTYVLGTNTLSGTVTANFATNDEVTASNLWETYFTQIVSGSPSTTYPMWRTLISLIMLRVKQGWTVVLNSNGYTAYYVSNPALSPTYSDGIYRVGPDGLSWITQILGGSITIDWDTHYPHIVGESLPGWLTPNWTASRMQLPNNLVIASKTYGTLNGYLMCYAIKYGAGKILVGGAGTNALPVNLILLSKVYG